MKNLIEGGRALFHRLVKKPCHYRITTLMHRLFIALLLFSAACSKPDQPSQIKEFVMNQVAPDTVETYIVIANSKGEPVAADGRFIYLLNGTMLRGYGAQRLYGGDRTVTVSDFKPYAVDPKYPEEKTLAILAERTSTQQFRDYPAYDKQYDFILDLPTIDAKIAFIPTGGSEIDKDLSLTIGR